MPTAISEIHGAVPQNERAQRGLEVTGRMGYIPYTQMTQGEMRLALLAEQARIYAAVYRDFPEYRQAATMLENALYNGVSNGVNFIGSLDGDLLQQVAREITVASRNTRPASRGALIGRESLGTGIGLDPIVNYVAEKDCVQYATREANKKFGRNKPWTWWENSLFKEPWEKKFYTETKAKCQLNVDIEKIFNDSIESSSHHVLYKSIPQGYPGIRDNFVRTKRLFHLTGISGLSNAAEMDKELISGWTETAILRRNSTEGVGAMGSTWSSMYLSPDPEGELARFITYSKIRGGAGVQGIGEPASVTILAIVKLVAAIGSAIAAAALFQGKLNEKKFGVMSEAKGFGTADFSADKSDWDGSTGTGAGTGISNNTLLLLAAAGGAYLLLND